MSEQKTPRSARTRAAQQAAEIRREHRRRQQRRRNLLVTSAVLAVLAVIAGIGYAVQSGRDTTGRAETAPHGATSAYGVPRGSADAPVTVTVYEDFMCAVCHELEQATSTWLPSYIDDGKVRVEYRPIAFLNRFSSGIEYSTRAANAYAAVLDTAGPDAAGKFHDLLFANQPEEGSSGLSDSRLVELAVQAGAPEADVRRAVQDRTFEQWVDNATDRASKDKVTGTPTVEVDGERLDPLPIPQTDAALHAAIDKALG